MITGQMRPLAHHPHQMAHGLASLGRGGDSMLVHMSPREVGALDTIAKAAGGHLTRNPHTGLPEAGWLSSLLPMLAGGLATVFTGGVAAPLLAGAATGALTGNKNLPLWERLGLGALGGYGGSGVAAGLLGSAGSGLSTAAANEATNMDPILANAGLPTTSDAATGVLSNGVPASVASPETLAAQLSPAQNALQAYNSFVPGSSASQSADYLSQGLKNLGTSSGRSAFMQGFGDNALGKAGTALATAAPLLMQPQESTNVPQEKPWYYTAAPGYSSLYNPGTINPNIAKLGYLPAGQAAFIGQGWNPGQYTQTYPGIPSSQNPVGAKAGGLMSLRRFDQGGSTSTAPTPMSSTLSNMNNYYQNMLQSNMQPTSMLPPPPSSDAMNAYLAQATQMVTPQPYSAPTTSAPTTPAASVPTSMASYTNPDTGAITNYPTYTYDPATGQYTQAKQSYAGQGGFHMAGGGLADLTPHYAAGGKLLHGDGDGMSDDIPAVITGHKPQRAALADGEFVIPADVVSHLGNGSTNAGAKRLYSMMDKVRRARTGNPNQGKQINSSKFMPV